MRLLCKSSVSTPVATTPVLKPMEAVPVLKSMEAVPVVHPTLGVDWIPRPSSGLRMAVTTTSES